ncbi:MAG: hypothetical protein HZA50_13510 [Planctomycetes bacterium]|nr:hypothetical protein [Planctomycetota bacterium]
MRRNRTKQIQPLTTAAKTARIAAMAQDQKKTTLFSAGATACLQAVLAIILLAAALCPIWSVDYVPSQDGPMHLENASALAGRIGASFCEYYYAQLKPVPNTAGYLVMAALVKIFTPAVAQKVFLSLYVLLMAAGFWYLLAAIRPKAGPCAVFCLPLVYNELLSMGFYSFMFGAAMCLFAIGYWLRCQANLTVKRAAVLGLLALLLYFCHLFAIAALWLVMGIMTVAGLISELAGPQQNGAIKSSLRKAGLLAAVNLPAGALACWYFLQSGGDVGQFGLGVADRLAEIVRGDVLVAFSLDEFIVSVAFNCLLAAATGAAAIIKFRHRRWNRGDWLLAAAGLFLAGSLFFPDVSAGGAYVHQRFAFYFLLALAAWAAANLGTGRLAFALASAAAILGVIAVCLQTANCRRLEPFIRQYMEAARIIPPDSTLLPLCFNGYGVGLEDKARPDEQMSLKIAVFYHQDGLIAAQKQAVSLANYSASTDKFIYRYHDGKDPFRHIARETGFKFEPPCVDFLTYRGRTGGQADYVLTWDMDGRYAGHPLTASIRRQLDAGYVKIFQSSGGLCRVYRRIGLEQPGRTN